MSEYSIEVYQPKEFPVLTIMVSIGKDSTHWIGPTMEVIAGELSSIEINAVSLPRWPKLNTAKYFPKLWELAIAAGECLAGLIQTADDLRRPVEASIEGDTVVVRFAGEKNTRAEDKQPDSDESDNFDEPFGFDPDGDYSDWAGEQI